MNAKKAKALRKLVKRTYTDPRMAEYVYKKAKKEIKGGR